MTPDRALATAAGVLLFALDLAGCSQAPPAVPAGSAAETSASVLEPMPPAAGEAEPAAAPEADPEAVTERKEEPAPGSEPNARAADPTVIPVVSKPKPRTLWEASVAARKQRAESPPRERISVTDENLHEFQGAELTFAAPRPEAAPGDEAEAGSTAVEDAARNEAYWRSRLLDLRLRLRSGVDELAELDERAAGLRRSFYAEDDPYVRDAEIKPAWDRALDRMGELRRELLVVARELEVALEEGRQAGALPGWLREGLDLEPEPEELPRPSQTAHEPGEPTVLEIEEQEPPPVRR